MWHDGLNHWLLVIEFDSQPLSLPGGVRVRVRVCEGECS